MPFYVSSTLVPEFFLEIFLCERERKTRYELVYCASTQIIICVTIIYCKNNYFVSVS